LAFPFLLSATGAGGCLTVACLLALGAMAAAAPPPARKPAFAAALLFGAAGLAVLGRVDARFPIPAKQVLEPWRSMIVTPPERSRWSAINRIDVLAAQPGKYFFVGQGRKAGELPPFPEEKVITQDGDAWTGCFNFSEHPEALIRVQRSLYAVAMRLKDKPSVMILGYGGGVELWAAQLNDASRVLAVELNRATMDVHRTVVPGYSRRILEDPRFRLVHGEGRSALMRTDERFDVVQISGVDTWAGLAAGAYVLAENYLYTVEALGAMHDRLADGGIVQIMRFAQDAEVLRLLSNAHEMFRRRGIADFRRSVAVLRTDDQFAAVLIKKGPFTAQEVRRLETIAEEAGMDLLYAPGRPADGAVSRFVQAQRKDLFIRNFPRNLAPTTDDRPYFFNFYKWNRPLQTAPRLGDIPIVSQGNPFLLWAQLVFVSVVSASLILLPLTFAGGRGGAARPAAGQLLYFAGLGLGFIGVELTAIQKLTLFLGHPAHSLNVTLSAMLTFAGLGSWISGRWSEACERRRAAFVPALWAALALLLLLAPALAARGIGWPLPARIAASVALLAPLSLLLGFPFAYGIRLLDCEKPEWIPWAWAVNGCMTVVGSVLSVIVSMNFGFNAVLMLSGLIYAAAFAALPRLKR
jgi:spermidine synthase